MKALIGLVIIIGVVFYVYSITRPENQARDAARTLLKDARVTPEEKSRLQQGIDRISAQTNSVHGNPEELKQAVTDLKVYMTLIELRLKLLDKPSSRSGAGSPVDGQRWTRNPNANEYRRSGPKGVPYNEREALGDIP